MSYAEVRELQSALHTASDIVFGLQATPTDEESEQILDALRRALNLAHSLAGVHGGTGCAEHPRGAIDPLYGDAEDPLPPGYGKCLLCNDRRRRAGTQRHARV
ncbi:hypothetical protein [Streptomyces meridianus]|uniref:Uncharacterized protein n=1 Tax=Streptomyces meridianus TaxID=2938945 RepID=A0ABT0X2L1_9ACTN|nr:hypothetical protein [Streptomyces meridianus]MCM2576772.1 hypothetical protein [Streptomyces meridianus]